MEQKCDVLKVEYTIYNSTIGTFLEGFSEYLFLFLALLNFFPISENEYTPAPLKVNMENTIVYGHNEGSVLVNEKSDHPSQIKIHHSLLKLKNLYRQLKSARKYY